VAPSSARSEATAARDHRVDPSRSSGGATLALEVGDRDVTTVEGSIRPEEAFIKEDAMQRGFCTATIGMRCRRSASPR